MSTLTAEPAPNDEPDDEPVLLSPAQLRVLATARMSGLGGVEANLSGNATDLPVARTLARDGMVELIEVYRGSWRGRLTEAALVALAQADVAAVTELTRQGRRLSWRRVAHHLGAQMAVHAHCPTHLGPPVPGCSSCDSRVAYILFAGRVSQDGSQSKP